MIYALCSILICPRVLVQAHTRAPLAVSRAHLVQLASTLIQLAPLKRARVLIVVLESSRPL